jgi:predicted Rossmann fold flavoprotein
MNKKVIIIGGGAAGFFAAVNLKRMAPDVDVTILEKSNKLLAKVRISGGGRCNVTHACFDNSILVRNYPRGEKALRGAFSRFSTTDTVKWFEERGVKLKTEEDGRMFPVTDDSSSIVNCLLAEAEKLGVRVRQGVNVKKTEKKEKVFILYPEGGEPILADHVLIATGGNPKKENYDWIRNQGSNIIDPVPSLFTFNVPGNAITELMGLSVPEARVRIANSKLESSGPLLITHWGFSGPAILRLSAWAARELSLRNYHFPVLISWLGNKKEDEIREHLVEMRKEWKLRQILTHPLYALPKRLWEYLVSSVGIGNELKWADLPNKNMNRLIEKLINDVYEVKGKTTFKEEFVTCGGVSLNEIDFRTMESRTCKGLYFAGEVLDVDGITGGFNFQAAWTTGFIAAQAMAEVKSE